MYLRGIHLEHPDVAYYERPTFRQEFEIGITLLLRLFLKKNLSKEQT